MRFCNRLVPLVLVWLAGCTAAPTAPPAPTPSPLTQVREAADRGFARSVPPAATQPARRAAAAPGPWKDRRPIAWLDMANEQERNPKLGMDPAKNPRAWNAYWHRDPAGNPLDARDLDYVAKFAEAFKTRCFGPGVAIAKRHNCQIISLRDWPGRRFDQPNGSYEGWPAGPRPPECTNALIVWMAQACKDNGLGLGFGLRQTFLRLPDDGRIENARQLPEADPATVILFKIQEVRWLLSPGSTGLPYDLSGVFNFAYLDSNNEVYAWAAGKGPVPIPAAALAKVQECVPGVLLMTEWGSLGQPNPEWGSLDYLDVRDVAPWREMKYPAHPQALARAKATGAFEIMVPTPGWAPSEADKRRLAAERWAGHIFLVNAAGNASYESPANAVVDECERMAAQAK